MISSRFLRTLVLAGFGWLLAGQGHAQDAQWPLHDAVRANDLPALHGMAQCTE